MHLKSLRMGCAHSLCWRDLSDKFYSIFQLVTHWLKNYDNYCVLMYGMDQKYKVGGSKTGKSRQLELLTSSHPKLNNR